MAWWHRFVPRWWKTSDNTARVARPVSVRASRASLPSGRITSDKDTGFLPGLMVLAPPPTFDETWHILQADRRLFETMSPARLLEVLADLSPEVSRALWDFLRLCNPGWEATANRKSNNEKAVQDTRAQAALDAFLDHLDDLYGSVDIVFGRLFMDAFLRGALFAELVLDSSGRVPVDLATPDPISVRFRRVDDPQRGPIWVPGQWQKGQFVLFDRPTVRYTPVDPFPSSPYGRPLAAPALFTSLFLLAMLHDIRRVVQQQGYPRLDLSLDTEKLATVLDAYSDDPEKYQAALQSVVDDVIQAYSELEPDDAYVHTDVVSVNRPVGAVDSSSLGAVDDLIAALERMATRALKSMPIMMGLSESNTETQANRQYEIYAAGIKSIQHYAETLLERLLTLGLEAQGLQAKVQFRFAELRAAEQLRDAQVEAMKITNAAAKRDQGWYTQDQASEEVTGEPAVGPAPSQPQSQPQNGGDDNDGQEALNQGSDRDTPAQRAPETRVKLIPDGADEPLLPVPDIVTISDSEVDRAISEWDEVMPDYAGMLEADVSAQDDFDEARSARASGDESPWTYDANTHRYRASSGRFIGQRQMTELRDAFVDAKRGAAQSLAGDLAAGRRSLQEFEVAFRREIKSVFVDQYVLGKGGRNNMTAADWGAVGREIRNQYQYAHEFAQEIAEGRLSAAQIASRSAQYISSSTQAFERGRVASYGAPVLPAYPSDGQTACRSNCKCSWRIEETEEAWNCTWVVRGGESCRDCLNNASRWNPFVIAKGENARTREDVTRILEGISHNGHA